MVQNLLNDFSWQGWFLFFAAVFGILHIVYYVIKYFFGHTISAVPELCVILLVKNAEDYIEGVIRTLAAEMVLGKKNASFFKLIVVDDCSEDATPKLLELLSREFHFLHVIRMSKLVTQKSPIEAALSVCEEDVVCIMDVTHKTAPQKIIETIMFLINKSQQRRSEKVSAINNNRDEA